VKRHFVVRRHPSSLSDLWLRIYVVGCFTIHVRSEGGVAAVSVCAFVCLSVNTITTEPL